MSTKLPLTAVIASAIITIAMAMVSILTFTLGLTAYQNGNTWCAVFAALAGAGAYLTFILPGVIIRAHKS